MQSQKLVVTQKQQLKMSPQMYQSLEILALPVMDLRERVQEEMEKNPALEMKEASSVSYERISQPIPAERDYFENSSDPGFTSSYSREDSDAKQKFLEGAFSHSESLQEHLFMQLHMLPLSDEELKTGEIIISHLDDNGFCRKSIEEVVPEELQDYAVEMISKIQNFDPPGVCTEGPIESLAIQTRMSSSAPPYSELVIREDLELLRRGKYQEAAKRHGITADEVLDILEFIKTLTPYPGQQFESEPTHYIIPDLIIRKLEGKLRLFLNDDQIPELSIDPNFVSMADDEHHPSKEAERYIQQAVRDARWLINSIEMRSNTLKKVGAALLKYQYDFFLSGPKSLHPLTLRDIADEISVHETTVSRISQSKFIQTDWGIFPIKYFFSSAVNSTKNTQPDYSKTSVKEIMKEIIEEYSGSKRLSDQKISNLLAERGIKIARRTVAKYRKELHIDSSFDRNSASSS
ncbi:MAG: RNA polymerase factor sigma-54 [Spirochaetales bacterium]|nr:RNA polymerase factor sigma-54 [Spirochaetales bacterium]